MPISIKFKHSETIGFNKLISYNSVKKIMKRKMIFAAIAVIATVSGITVKLTDMILVLESK